MNRLFVCALIAVFISIIPLHTTAQSDLQHAIERVLSSKKAVVGVSIADSNGKEIVTIHGNRHFPLQSVFKFHIALVVLSQVDEGMLSLDQQIELNKEDMTPGMYSPIRDNYPDGVSLTIGEILTYTVAESDNIGCDILLKLIGGPQVVETYFKKKGFPEIAITYNEETQQAEENWELQFQNWITSTSSNEILIAFYNNDKQLLSQKSYDFIWKVMSGTTTGPARLKGKLPKSTKVSHKTGTSGANDEGTTAAVNDIGVVFLPEGQHFFISVFVSDSKENEKTNEEIIATIAKASWDYFLKEAK